VVRTLVALLWLAAAVPCAQARDALQAIDDCLGKLDSAIDVDYAHVAARCPDLPAALAASPWAPWLPADWNRPDSQLSPAGLTELRTLLSRAARPAAARPAPPTDRVTAVLAAVTHTDDRRGGWWLRFKDWLRRVLAQGAGEQGWLARWLTRIDLSGAAGELVVWGTLALVVALAGGIVINELRFAGFPGRRVSGARAAAADSRRPRSLPTLAQIERAAPERQPALLLEFIAERLAEQDRLPPARALTARELGQRARLPDEAGRGLLAELVAVCERLRFSAEQVGDKSLAAALRAGRLLLATLDAAPVVRSGAEARTCVSG
jgi:hypothetical protein